MNKLTRGGTEEGLEQFENLSRSDRFESCDTTLELSSVYDRRCGDTSAWGESIFATRCPQWILARDVG